MSDCVDLQQNFIKFLIEFDKFDSCPDPYKIEIIYFCLLNFSLKDELLFEDEIYLHQLKVLYNLICFFYPLDHK